MTTRAVGLYRSGLAAALAATALPYGYTLTVWSTGEFVRRAHPTPTLADIFLFVVGAAAGYGSLRLTVGHAEAHSSGLGRRHILRAGTIQLVSVTAAAAVGAALATVPALPAWPLAPFGSTFTYLALAAIEEAFELRGASRGSGGDR